MTNGQLAHTQIKKREEIDCIMIHSHPSNYRFGCRPQLCTARLHSLYIGGSHSSALDNENILRWAQCLTFIRRITLHA
jgi:hypothetical protein